MATAPDPGLVARFAADFAATLGHAAPLGEALALAVSGGPDSMAMLALAAAAFPGRVIAATVDHRLRAASASEAAMVADHCRAINVPHATLIPVSPIAGASLQARAREARYALLERWTVEQGARILITAHHADDQAETFLMRAARGSGVAGLGGIRARQRVDVSFPVDATPRSPGIVSVADVFGLDIVRPLLGWRRRALRDVVDQLGLPFVDDPSNEDARFDRARFRALLAREAELDPVLVAQSARAAAEADDALRAHENWLLADRRVLPANVDDPDNQCWLAIADLPRELQRRLARAAIADVRLICGITRPDFSTATNIEPLLDALRAGGTATQAGVVASAKGGIWRFLEAPPRRSA